MLFHFSLFTIGTIFFCACKDALQKSSGSGNKLSDERLTLVAGETIEIPIDSTSLNWSPYPLYFTNDTCELYVTANEYLNGIDFYDLDDRKLIKRITFPKEGPGGILSTRKIYLSSLDSIYIYAEDKHNKILLSNFKGEVIGRYDVNRPDGVSYMANLLESFTVLNGSAYFAHMIFGHNRYQVGYKTMIRLDLQTGVAEAFGPYYPLIFNRYIYYHFMPYYTFGPNQNIVVRYGSLPNIYNHDITIDSTYVIPMRSAFQDKDIVPDTLAFETRDVNHDFEEIEQGQYTGIFYDKYHKVYYSIFLKGMPIRDSEGNKHVFTDLPVSIIIFNENFEYCGEVALEKNIYFNNNFLCTKKGLLIPMSHPNNPDNDENTLRFRIFKLAKAD